MITLSVLIGFLILVNLLMIWLVLDVHSSCIQLNQATRMSLDRVAEKLWGEYGARFFINLEQDRNLKNEENL